MKMNRKKIILMNYHIDTHIMLKISGIFLSFFLFCGLQQWTHHSAFSIASAKCTEKRFTVLQFHNILVRDPGIRNVVNISVSFYYCNFKFKNTFTTIITHCPLPIAIITAHISSATANKKKQTGSKWTEKVFFLKKMKKNWK